MIWQGGNSFAGSDLTAENAEYQCGETPFIMPGVVHPLPALRSRIPV